MSLRLLTGPMLEMAYIAALAERAGPILTVDISRTTPPEPEPSFRYAPAPFPRWPSEAERVALSAAEAKRARRAAKRLTRKDPT